MLNNETIIAITSPIGESSIGMIRISGEKALNLILRSIKINKYLIPKLATFDEFYNLNGEYIDQIIVIFYKSPNSFTGENSIEIYSHGNPIILKKILNDICLKGARIALPGEFTKRAFLNKKIDLTQAEAIINIISAKNEYTLKIANNQIKGIFAKKINSLLHYLLETIAYIEASIDFSEDEINYKTRKEYLIIINYILLKINELLMNKKYSIHAINKNMKLVLIGTPNSGKSSLFNYLLGEDRVIVSNIPGTTRDFIKDEIILKSYNIDLVDTAGIRNSTNKIETLGIKKSLYFTKQSDLTILLLNGTENIPKILSKIMLNIKSNKLFIVWNKNDLISFSVKKHLLLKNQKCFNISILYNNNLSNLKKNIYKYIKNFYQENIKNNDIIIINERHHQILMEAKNILQNLKLKIHYISIELLTNDLMHLLNTLKKIIHENINNENILNKIFNKFCIGK